MNQDKDNKARLRSENASDRVMTVIWGLLIAAGIALSIIILYKVIFWQKDEKLYPYLVSESKPYAVTPKRGDILDCKGRALATSTYVYDLYLDCKIVHDTIWQRYSGDLAVQLSRLFGDKTAHEYHALLKNGRSRRLGSLPIHMEATRIQVLQTRKMPIFNLGRNGGGYIEKGYEKRLYPYGASARRTIGYVRDNADTSRAAKKGIEGACDSVLHGTNGVQYKARSDKGMIPVFDRNNKRERNGKSVRTTIDIDIQNIADIALHKAVERSALIEKSCVIVLETKTGAVRAMVNLGRDSEGNISERDNYAVLNAEAPGSIFKSAVVMALLDEGYVTTLDHEIPTFGGVWRYNRIEYNDIKHVGLHRFPGRKIKLREAFEMSANNPFRQLICDTATFGLNPQRFIDKVKSFGLFDEIDFELKGIAKPFILDPSMKKRSAKGSWDGGTFPRMAIGYGMELSPLNLVTFYNAIANDGKMMKPYLIEAVLDEDGDVDEEFAPTVMHERICSRSTIDTLKRMMSMVTKDKGGTAYYQLHGAVCPIAGKTGTAQRVFKMRNGKYGYNDGGIESQQGSFVGFFPVDNPKYTAIAVVWSRPSLVNFFGASYAAPVFREIADKIYCLNED